MRSIPEIRIEIKFHENEVERLQKELHAACWAKIGLRPGDLIVATTGRHEDKTFRLEDLSFQPEWTGQETSIWQRPWATGRPKLKNGKWGQRTICLYRDWRKHD